MVRIYYGLFNILTEQDLMVKNPNSKSCTVALNDHIMIM